MTPNKPVKQQGVMVTSGQRDTAPSQTIIHAAKMEMYAVEYGDNNGRKHVTMFLRVGDVWYEPKTAEQWCSELHTLSKWAADQMTAKVGAPTPAASNLPKEDAVDVL